jgi:hypothetical protein
VLLSVELAVTLVVSWVFAGQDHPSLGCIETCGGAEGSIVAPDSDRTNTIGHSSEIAKTRRRSSSNWMANGKIRERAGGPIPPPH